jgi:hypothetical protein
MTLCTRDDVKLFLKKTDTESDELIDALIPAAQGFIEGYCRRDFEAEAVPADEIEYHDGGVNRIFLKQFPVNLTPTVKLYEDSDRVFGESTRVPDMDFYVDYDSGIIFVDYELELGWGAVKVIYKPKAISTDQPTGEVAVAKQACIEIVARKLKTGTSGDIGVASRTLAGGSTVTFSQVDILPETKIALDSIARPL